jgi:hypothetical protein
LGAYVARAKRANLAMRTLVSLFDTFDDINHSSKDVNEHGTRTDDKGSLREIMKKEETQQVRGSVESIYLSCSIRFFSYSTLKLPPF